MTPVGFYLKQNGPVSRPTTYRQSKPKKPLTVLTTCISNQAPNGLRPMTTSQQQNKTLATKTKSARELKRSMAPLNLVTLLLNLAEPLVLRITLSYSQNEDLTTQNEKNKQIKQREKKNTNQSKFFFPH